MLITFFPAWSSSIYSNSRMCSVTFSCIRRTSAVYPLSVPSSITSTTFFQVLVGLPFLYASCVPSCFASPSSKYVVILTPVLPLGSGTSLYFTNMPTVEPSVSNYSRELRFCSVVCNCGC